MRIAVLTTGRQDWSILQPLARALAQSADFQLCLVAGGMHGRGGRIPDEIDGLRVDAKVDVLPQDDSRLAIATAAGRTTEAVAEALNRVRAEALLLVGDRTESLAAVVAATCLQLPVIHLHGGEETEGAIDNACRHAITKLSHLHLVAHESFARRVRQMGEEPSRVFVTGALGIDAARTVERMSRAELAAELGITDVNLPWILCTHHPTTLGEDPAREFSAVLEGLRRVMARQPVELVFTVPNADAGNGALVRLLRDFAQRHPRVHVVEALGARRYYSMLSCVAVMVGNSSSGILEAPFFGLPVVNVGDRQKGRLRSAHVVDVTPDADAVADAVAQSLAPERRAELTNVESPFGDGHATEKVLAALRAVAPTLANVRKRFHAVP
ncbi:MAG: UDP-N-acetylglucosamine 2-epimerase [Myxococcota bacterium]